MNSLEKNVGTDDDRQDLIIKLKLIADISLSMLAQSDFQDKINFALNKIGEATSVSRIYIFEDSEDKSTTSNTFEWCNDEIESQKHALQRIPYSIIPSWRNIIETTGKIISNDITTLPKDIFSILYPQGIRSIAVFPLTSYQKNTGFIGFDQCMKKRIWRSSELELLRTLSEILSSALTQEKNNKTTYISNLNYQTLFEAIDDLLFVLDKSGKIIHTNSSALRKLEYSIDEITKMNVIEVHPSRYANEVKETVLAMFNGERNFCPIPLQAKHGYELPVETRIWPGEWNGRPCLFGLSKDRSREAALLEKFDKLFDLNPSLMAVSSIPERTFTHVNKAFLNKLGFEYTEVIGKTSTDLGLFVNSDNQLNISREVEKFGLILNTELDINRKDGEILHGLFSGTIIQEQDSRSFLTVMVDTTEQYKLKMQLEDQKIKIENILTGTNAGTWEWNIKTGELELNSRWAEIIGYDLEQLKPISIDTWIRFCHPEDLKNSKTLLDKHFRGELSYYEHAARMLHRSGEWVWVLDRGKVASWDENGNPLLMFGTHIDITELKKNEEEIRHLANHDALTGLPTLRLAKDRTKMALASAERKNLQIAILYLDLDGFKKVNDTLGHAAGDHVLKETANRLLRSVRRVDTVARIGGDEFLVILIDLTSIEVAKKISQKIIESVSIPFTVGNQEALIGISIGINMCDKSAADVDEAIKKADQAMFKVKKSGKNAYEFAKSF